MSIVAGPHDGLPRGGARPLEGNSSFLRTVKAGAKAAVRPVWFMRQAGRSLPEYRELRAHIPMLEACFTPDLVAEITLQPVVRHRVDAAIFYSDIVVPIKACGFDIDIVPGVGPVTKTPIRTKADVARLPDASHCDLEPISTAVRLIKRELSQIALIGFAGAPFTVASYLIEGGPSKGHELTKAFMYSQESLWHELLTKISDLTIAFLRAQIDAGADAVQLFDSWSGTLSAEDYRRYVYPHSQRVLAAVAEVPRIHFGIGTSEFIADMARPAEVIGVDWRLRLTEARRRVGKPIVLQGNLDPAYLTAPWNIIEAKVRDICRDADLACSEGALGHIFNLGHGVPASTDPGVLTALVELVHTL